MEEGGWERSSEKECGSMRMLMLVGSIFYGDDYSATVLSLHVPGWTIFPLILLIKIVGACQW